jgi:hypothetical protein
MVYSSNAGEQEQALLFAIKFHAGASQLAARRVQPNGIGSFRILRIRQQSQGFCLQMQYMGGIEVADLYLTVEQKFTLLIDHTPMLRLDCPAAAILLMDFDPRLFQLDRIALRVAGSSQTSRPRRGRRRWG